MYSTDRDIETQRRWTGCRKIQGCDVVVGRTSAQLPKLFFLIQIGPTVVEIQGFKTDTLGPMVVEIRGFKEDTFGPKQQARMGGTAFP